MCRAVGSGSLYFVPSAVEAVKQVETHFMLHTQSAEQRWQQMWKEGKEF